MTNFTPRIFRREDGEYFIVTAVHKKGNPKTKYRCTEQVRLIVEIETAELIEAAKEVVKFSKSNDIAEKIGALEAAIQKFKGVDTECVAEAQKFAELAKNAAGTE